MAGTYRDLLRTPGMRAPLVASAIGRLPLGAMTLATILLVHAETGSFASAGVVEAFMTLGVAIGLPMLGRRVDRRGHAAVLVPAALVEGVALVALIVTARSGAPVAAISAVAFVAGVSSPPLSACMRSLWSARLDDESALQSAYALEAVLIEVAFVLGPLLAAGLTAAASPSAAMLAAAALLVGGTLAFSVTAQSRAWRGAPGTGHWAGSLRVPGVWVIAAGAGFFGFGQGVLELTLPAFGAAHGSPAIAGPLLAIQAAASLCAGAWYGARIWRAPAEDRYARMSMVLALGFAPLALATSVPVLAVLMVFPGFGLAPVTSIAYVLAARLTPEGALTETFGWLVTATVVGAGLGSAIGGAVVSHDVTAGFLVAFGGVCLSAVAAGLGRRTLARPLPGTL